MSKLTRRPPRDLKDQLELPGFFKPTGLVLPEKTTYEEWHHVGRFLRAVEGRVMWWLGDWLNFGERKYGEKYTAALEATGFEYQTVRNAKWVAGRFELSRRRDNLSWSVHAEVAALEPQEQEMILGQAAADELTRRDVRILARQAQAQRRLRTAAEFPTGKYRVIYADPPWQYGNEQPAYHTEQANYYPVMAPAEIAALPVATVAESDAVLFLWATSPILPEALEVAEAWSFEYKTAFVWDKIKHNMGHYNSVRHEFLLLCIRGSCPPDAPTLFDSVVTIERSAVHSEKPERFREIIDTIYPIGPRIELFSRKAATGWARWGNEPADLS
jgi:N6-adenosine-specific RNA methylase IME4